ncbi:MAG: glycosyltransferase, partial [Flavobacteriaceae bacterium]|nr:glycosyltransferase [Flavobacteriaceae bacterium]
MHIAILSSRLDLPGGIERAVVNTANLFTQKGNSVSLLIMDNSSESFYPIHPSINIMQQQLSFGITPEGNVISRKIKMLSDVLALRKILKKINPDIVISSEYPFTVASVLARPNKKLKIYSWE